MSYKIKFSMMVGNKKINQLMRDFDLGTEGVFWEQTGELTSDKPLNPTKEWRKKVMSCFRQAADTCDMEIRNIKFIVELT